MAPTISNLSKLSAEFLGTFMLVFVVGMILTAGEQDPSLSVFGPTAIGFTLMVLVYAVGQVSGGHLNPAVTLAATLQKEIAHKDALMYMAVQSAAGVAAGILAGTMYGYRGTASALGPKAEFWLGAPIVEFLYTFMLCFVVLNVCMSKKYKERPNGFHGVAIGFVVIAGGYGGGHVSGAAFNPAIALGMNFVHPGWKSFWLPIYILVEFLGAIMAVVAFHIVRPDSRVKFEGVEAGGDPRASQITGQGAEHANKMADKLMDLFDPEDTTECLGTLFYTLSVALNQLDPNKGGVWSNAASLMCMIFAVGDISGGVFNPAITLACLGRFFGTDQGFGDEKLCDPKKSAKEGPKYMIAQLIGAAAGGGLTLLIWCFSGQMPAAVVGPQNGHSQWQGFCAELFGTFLLAFVFLCVATLAKPLEDYKAFAVGGVVVAAGYAFGPLSGGLFNPAVTVVNSAFYGMSMFWKIGPVSFFLAQLVGGVLAAVVFKFLTHPHEYENLPAGYTNLP